MVDPLPGAPLDRMISLSTRAGVLADIPTTVAAQVRNLVEDRVVTPSVRRWPWLAPALRVL